MVEGDAFWTCPNCGGHSFSPVGGNRQQCVYCGTVIAPPSPHQARRVCPHCGHENDQSDLFCRQCGQSLARPIFTQRGQLDPAVKSILITVFGTFMVPWLGSFVAPLIGLLIARRALEEARSMNKDDRLPHAAVVVSAIFLAFGTIQIVVVCGGYGGMYVLGLCDTIMNASSNVLDLLMGMV